MHKTKNSEILANIDFTKISEKKIMPQTGYSMHINRYKLMGNNVF